MSSQSTREAVARGVAFLAGRQRSDGSFEVLVSNANINDGRPRVSQSLFATSLVAGSLNAVDDAAARTVSRRAAGWLAGLVRPGGVWCFYTAASEQWFAAAPPDVDDTSCVAGVLRREGMAPRGDVRRILLANRDPRGRFYTWILLRRGKTLMLPPVWRSAAIAWHQALVRRQFWILTPAARDDVDAGVNANVLLHLGPGDHAAAVSAYLAGVVRRGEEAVSDKWYRDPIVVQYLISRVHASGIPGLEHVAQAGAARVLRDARADGSIGDSSVTTALGLSALSNWQYRGPELEHAAQRLLAAQLPSGGWPAAPVYHGGPASWGSEELSTGFCIEALST